MKIGLALGAGAARGWAHIGIIQALEELGIKIDVVAGCSIGAYVGSAYTNNKLSELGDWAKSLTEWQVLGLMGVGLHKGGLVSGAKVFQTLDEKFSAETFEQLQKPFAVVATDLYSGQEVCFKTGPIKDAVRSSCAIPGLFPPVMHQDRWLVDGAVVNPVPVNLCRMLGADFVFAVNLTADFRPQVVEKGSQEQQLNQRKTDDFFKKTQSTMQSWVTKIGDKAEALRQKMTHDTPSKVENEVNYDDEEYNQELLSNLSLDQEPLPVNTFPENVSPVTSPSIAKEKKANQHPPSMISVMSSSLEILQARVTRSRLAGDPPDVLIEPHLRDFGIMEFHRADELINEGRASVDRIAGQIRYQLCLD